MDGDLVKVGALWQNTTSEGNPYFNLDIEGKKYVVFPNNFKTEERQADFIAYKRVTLDKEPRVVQDDAICPHCKERCLVVSRYLTETGTPIERYNCSNCPYDTEIEI